MLFLVFATAASSQQPAPADTPPPSAQPATTDTSPAPAPPPSPAQDAPPQQVAPPQAATPQPTGPSHEAGTTTGASEASGGITEDQLKQMLVGKPLYLRGGYLSDNLSFNEHGGLNGQAPHASYTLCAIQFDKIHLTKRKVELSGARYGLHFLGALAYEDPTNAVDRVKITPKKKIARVSIDREIVVKPKKEKTPKPGKGKRAASSAKPSASPVELHPQRRTRLNRRRLRIPPLRQQCSRPPPSLKIPERRPQLHRPHMRLRFSKKPSTKSSPSALTSGWWKRCRTSGTLLPGGRSQNRLQTRGRSCAAPEHGRPES